VFDQQLIQSLAGQSEIMLTWSVNVHEPGDEMFVITIDSNNEIEEACEEENRVEFTVTVFSPWDWAITDEDLQREDPSQEFVSWDSLGLVVTVHNVGDQTAPPAVVTLFDGLPTAGGRAFGQGVTDSVEAGFADTIRVYWPENTEPGNHLLVGVIDPDTLLDEWNRDNNVAVRDITVRGDTLPPGVDVNPPWAGFQDGGYLSPDDTLRIRAWDDGSGVDAVFLSLDGNDITDGFTTVPDSTTGIPGVAIAVATPGSAGEHTLTATAFDQMGLSSSSEIQYEIAGGLLVRDVAAFPSPASRPTWITAVSSLPGDMCIDIYTPSGRLIRRLDGTTRYAGRVGLEWDLLDQDGDRIANGVYLIRFTLKTTDSSQSTLGKLVVRK
jgi:hypothetical protein